MPRKCCVVNCGMRYERDSVKFYRFPLIEIRRKKFTEISEMRQKAWLKAINRKDLKMESLKHTNVCSRHFISGVSAKLEDNLNPDWVPSLNLGYTNQKNTEKRLERYVRRIKRNETKKTKDINQPSTSRAFDEHVAEESETKSKDNCSQTDDFYYKELINNSLLNKYQDLMKENKELKDQIKKNEIVKQQFHNFSYASVKDDDKKIKYLTGFNDFVTFETIFEQVKPLVSVVRRGKLTKFDVFLMTLMKMRLGLPFTFLSLQYQVSVKTASNLFRKTIVLLHEELKDLVFWPDKKASALHMPDVFKDLFKDKAPIIIDCFEVFCEKPGNYLARSNVFFNCKHHHTLKYLIAISAFGSIIYISKGYDGRCSDKFIVENCGFLDFINEGDIILSDRGFLIEDSINKKRAKLIMLSFKNSNAQMEAIKVENNTSISRIRIHVERMIRVLRQKFLIFANRQPITTISEKYHNNMYSDYILKISCAIINLNPSVIDSAK